LKAILSVALLAIVIAALAYYIGRDSGYEEPPRIAEKPQATDVPAIDMVRVSGGTFTMGCTPEQGGGCDSDERPTHQVTLSDFEIGKYEVTQAQWQAVMGNNPSSFKGDNLPVERVSWTEVQEFIKKLNAATGGNYRLPTEAEWEYAARGGSRSRGYKYSGSGNIGDVAWYEDNSGSKTHPVGTKQANELGIHDMSGNVWEWVSDWYGGYSGNAQTNPQGASSGSYRVFRGGSWIHDAQDARVSTRYDGDPDLRYYILGFRLARSSK
jgi:formylglycine-generating enzyme required for sulfatase activity